MPWTFHTFNLNAKMNCEKSEEWLSYQFEFPQGINLEGNGLLILRNMKNILTFLK